MTWLTELLKCCFIIQKTHADTDELMTLLRIEICTFNRHFSGDNKTFPLQQVACILVTVLDSGDQYIGVMNNYIMVLMM